MIFNAISLAAGAALATALLLGEAGYCLIAAFIGAALSILIDRK
jgi:hypothetical protein